MSDANSGDAPRELTEIERVGPGTAESLRDAGFDSVADVRDASPDELADVEGIGDARANELKENAEALASDADEASVEVNGGEATAESEDDSDGADAPADEGGKLEGETDATAADVDMLEVRDAVRDVAQTLIDDPFDGIIEIERDEEGWYAVVEVVERSAVPDTQDILGRYEIDLDESGSVLGYRLTDRYRRGDVSNSG